MDGEPLHARDGRPGDATLRSSSLRSTSASARIERAICTRTQGRLEEALELFVSVEQDFPRDLRECARARHERGQTLRAQGRLDEAVATFASVESDYPEERASCASARNFRGLTVRIKGDPDEALDIFASVERDFPSERRECAWARIYHSGTLRALGDSAGALAGWESVEEDYSERPAACAVARLTRGQTVRGTGELDRAMDLFTSVERDYGEDRDSSAWARHERARTLQAAGKTDEAQKMRLSVPEAFPERRGRCVRALVMAGLYAEGESVSLELLRRAAEYTDWLRWSSPARFLLGEIDAEEFAGLMFDWHWRADVEFWLGEKARLEGLGEDAVRHYRRAFEFNVPGYTWPALEVRLRLRAPSAATRASGSGLCR